MRSTFAAIVLICLYTTISHAESLVALTATNQLVRFSSATPGSVLTTSVSGLTAGDRLVGIDVRPANNTLYGLATDSGTGGANAGVGRLYAINPISGAATLASTLVADPADTTAPNPFTSVAGSFFGVDFNPVADRLRIVSDTGQNLRVNVANGLTQLDGPAAYAAADANAGTPPQVVASAYTNSFAGAATTTLYNLDASISNLVTQVPPNNGTLNSQALLSLAAFPDASFDNSGQTGVGFAVLDGLTLSTVNLTNGAVTQIGAIGTVGSITGLAVLIPEPSSIMLWLGAAVASIALRRQRGK